MGTAVTDRAEKIHLMSQSYLGLKENYSLCNNLNVVKQKPMLFGVLLFSVKPSKYADTDFALVLCNKDG